jgi:predicted Zn-dependent protease
LIVSTDGVYQKDYRPMVRISVSVIVANFPRKNRGAFAIKIPL